MMDEITVGGDAHGPSYRELIFERNPVPMFVIHRESLRLVDVNASAVELYGHSREEFLRLSLTDIRPPEEVPAYLERLSKARQEPLRELHSGVYRHRKKDGTPLEVEVRSRPLTLDPPLQLATVIDVTDRLRAQAALRESEERFRVMADSAPVMIWMTDASGECTFVNRVWLEFTGRTQEQELGQGWGEGVHPEDHARCMAAYHEALRQQRPHSIDYRLRRVDGKYGWVEDHAVPRFSDDGSFVGFVGSCVDVSERRAAEEALRSSEQRFRIVAENIKGILWLSDPDFHWVQYVSPAYESLFELTRESLYRDSRSWLHKVHPDDRVKVEAGIPLRTQGPVEEEFRITLEDGSIRWIRNKAFPVQGVAEEVACVVGIAIDITSQKATEKQLRDALGEKELLLKEVHHRVKNNLQIISSLLRIQARGTNSPAVHAICSASQARIHAMALLHEALYRREHFARVDFAEYVRNLAAHLLASLGVDGQHFEFAVKESQLMDLDTAVACGLIVNELLTNSLKHAFSGGRIGTVRIEVNSAHESGDIVIIVGDDGRGISRDAAGGAGSVGLRLVELLVGQLEGTVSWENRGGTTVTVRIPRKVSSGDVVS